MCDRFLISFKRSTLPIAYELVCIAQIPKLELWTGGVKEKDSAKVFQSELLGWALGQLGFVHGLDLIQNGFLFLGNR